MNKLSYWNKKENLTPLCSQNSTRCPRIKRMWVKLRMMKSQDSPLRKLQMFAEIINLRITDNL